METIILYHSMDKVLLFVYLSKKYNIITYLFLIKIQNQDIILNKKVNYKIKYQNILNLPIYLLINKVSKINYCQEIVLLFIDNYMYSYMNIKYNYYYIS